MGKGASDRLEVLNLREHPNLCVMCADFITVEDEKLLVLSGDFFLRIEHWDKTPAIEVTLEDKAANASSVVALNNGDVVLACPGVCWLLRRTNLYLSPEAMEPIASALKP